jgi:hypothetical protein
MPIPLAWAPVDVSRVAAIEVYPAATLVAHRIRSTGYKKRDETEERREIIAALCTKLIIGESVADLATSADLVDAAVCVLAGADFLSGRAIADRTLAEREGWIWTAASNGTRRLQSISPWKAIDPYVCSVLRNVRAAAIMSGHLVKTGLFSGFFEQVTGHLRY